MLTVFFAYLPDGSIFEALKPVKTFQRPDCRQVFFCGSKTQMQEHAFFKAFQS